MKLCGVFLIAACLVYPQADTTIKLDVRQVLVPVVVTDHREHHVAGLKESDFEIYEDNVRQRIAGFSGEGWTSSTIVGGSVKQPDSDAAPANATATAAAARAPRRTYVICFDMLHTSFASFVRAREALNKLFDQEKDSGARFALISLGRQLQVVQTATADSAAIRAKINSPAFTATFGNMETTDFLNQINDVNGRMKAFCSACPLACGPKGRPQLCDAGLGRIRVDLDARGQQWSTWSESFLAGFQRVAEELAKIDGPHAIVLVSDGFTLKPGADFYAVASAWVPNSPYFQFDPPYNLQPELNTSLKVAARNNIVVYTIDARGVYNPSFLPVGSSSLAFQNASVLSQLASATGGLFFHGNNDLLQLYRNALADGREYYVLAYTSTNTAADGKYRRIVVKVNGKAQGVRAKQGYWAEGATSP